MVKKKIKDPISDAFNSVADVVQVEVEAQKEKQAELATKHLEDLENDSHRLGKMKQLADGLCLQIEKRFNLRHPVFPLVLPDLDIEGASGCYAIHSETAGTDVMVMWCGPTYADKILDGDVATIKRFIEAAVRTIEDYPELLKTPVQPSPDGEGAAV